MRWIRPFVALLLLAVIEPVSAREAILDYLSEIEVRRDAGLLVEEVIRVRAEGRDIKRGIYRDFPTDYTDRLGNRYRVDFRLMEVLRDGVSEPHHTERRDNGVRIYIGDRNVMLSPGVYTYTIRYLTNRQLGFFERHDELYWNVTGNGWGFPIEQARANITLPAGVPGDAVRLEAYTGPAGAKGQDYSAMLDGYSRATFQATRTLAPGEGLTIVATWPKGFVIPPTSGEKMSWFFADNREALIGVGGVLALLAYYLLVWHRVGRDPDPGVVVPLYEPEKGYSPASMRFIRNMGYDNNTFGAAIVNMAVAGYLTIEEDAGGEFTLRKTGQLPKLAAGEGAVASALFGSGRQEIKLERKNHRTIAKALSAHKRSLNRDYQKTYFVTNRGFILPGVAISLALLAATVLSLPSGDKTATAAFFMVWLSGWTVAVFGLGKHLFHSWRQVAAQGSGVVKAVAATLFALPFFAGEVVALGVLTLEVSPSVTLVLASVLAINILFIEWLKAPTLAGQRLLRKVEGFKLYLEVAEKDELDFKHPPEKTPELFEAYLPYALALGVEQQWADKFSSVLARAGTAAGQPRWYRGRHWNPRNLGGFTSSVGGAMSSAIASSSTAPGSSSGSGGGGSSGGGGGGGGGGGW